MSADTERHLFEKLVGIGVRDELGSKGSHNRVLQGVTRFHEFEIGPILPSYITGNGQLVVIRIAQACAHRLRYVQCAAQIIFIQNSIILLCRN